MKLLFIESAIKIYSLDHLWSKLYFQYLLQDINELPIDYIEYFYYRNEKNGSV